MDAQETAFDDEGGGLVRKLSVLGKYGPRDSEGRSRTILFSFKNSEGAWGRFNFEVYVVSEIFSHQSIRTQN